MSRIDAKFADPNARGKKAFVAYIMAGHPDYDSSLELAKGLPAAGVDIIELGLPFTDPMADGPTIQVAGQRALEAGQTLQKTLDMVRAQSPKGQRVKAPFNHARFAPEHLQRHLQLSPVICIVMFNVDGRGSAVVLAASMDRLGRAKMLEIFRQRVVREGMRALT